VYLPARGLPADALKHVGPGPVQIYLSSALTPAVLVPALPAASPRSDLLPLCKALFAQKLGAASDHETWVERKADRPSIAVAVERQLLDALKALTDSRGRRIALAGIRPWWAPVLKAAIEGAAGGGCAVLVDEETLLLCRWQGGELGASITEWTSLPRPQPAEQIYFLLKRRGLMAGEHPPWIYVVNAEGPKPLGDLLEEDTQAFALPFAGLVRRFRPGSADA
jgi:hypothetical protein